MDYLNELLSLAGRSGVYFGFPGSGFTATYASANTLTFGGAGIPIITDVSQILGVYEIPAAGGAITRPRLLLTKDAATRSYAAGVYTYGGAGFTNGSTFIPIVVSQSTLVSLALAGIKIQGSTADRAEIDAGNPVQVAGRSYTGAYATLTMVSAGANNDIDFIAKEAGVGGNAITIAFVQAATQSVTVVGTAITYNGDIAGGVTANTVIAALNAVPGVQALVDCFNTIGNDGTGNIVAAAATPLAGGLAGERVYEVHVNANGAITEVNSADALTSLQLIDNAIGTHGDTVATAGFLAQARAHAGIPAAVGDGQEVDFWANLLGSLGMFMTNALNRTNDSVTNWKQPPTGVQSGSQAISNAAPTALNGGVAFPCVAVIVQNRVGNGPIAMGDATIAGVNEGTIFQAGAWEIVEIDDVAKLIFWATNLNDPIDWYAVTR